jgi:hypothetical protein
MKELYTKPELLLEEFKSVDVLTASPEDTTKIDVIDGDDDGDD